MERRAHSWSESDELQPGDVCRAPLHSDSNTERPAASPRCLRSLDSLFTDSQNSPNVTPFSLSTKSQSACRKSVKSTKLSRILPTVRLVSVRNRTDSRLNSVSKLFIVNTQTTPITQPHESKSDKRLHRCTTPPVLDRKSLTELCVHLEKIRQTSELF